MAATITLFNTDNSTGTKTVLSQLGLDPEDAAIFSQWLTSGSSVHGASEISYKEMHHMLYTHQACSYASSELSSYIRQWQVDAISALSADDYLEQNCVSGYPDQKSAKGKSVMFEVTGLPDSL